MPRNVAGVYSLPAVINPVVTGTTIATTWANPTLSDIANAITDSIDRQGRTTILANLKMSNFKHTGAAAGAASGEYLVYDQTAGRFASLSVGGAVSPWGGNYKAIDVGLLGAFAEDGGGSTVMAANSYFDGTNWRAKAANTGGLLIPDILKLSYYYIPTVASPGDIQTPTLRFRVEGDGRLYGTGLHNNANSVAGTTNQYIASGVTVCNMASIGGIAVLSATINLCWMRVGNVVTFAGNTFVQSSTGTTNGVAWSIDPPIASNFQLTTEGSGVGASAAGQFSIYSDPTSDKLIVGGTQATGASYLVSVHGTYEIKT